MNHISASRRVSERPAKRWHIAEPDWFLALVLLLCFTLFATAVSWGRVETWNPDQRVFIGLFSDPDWPLHPGNLLKPTFVTYFHLVASRAPVRVLSALLDLAPEDARSIALIWPRVLNIGFFLGTVCLIYAATKQAFGLAAGRAAALVLATSAGFMPHAIFLSVDTTLTFFMAAAAYFACRILRYQRTVDYLLAGAATGLAMGTKYNGAIIGIVLPVSHLLVHSWPHGDQGTRPGAVTTVIDLLKYMFSRKLLLGIGCVPLFFVLSTPYALLDYTMFRTGWIYNIELAPHWSGETVGHSYDAFFGSSLDLIGAPGTVLVVSGGALAVVAAIAGLTTSIQVRTCLLIASAFLTYAGLIGAFPHFETRFALPVFPLPVVFAGALVAFAPRWLSIPLVGATAVYGVICCVWVGARFAEDPRTKFQEWAGTHLAAARVTAERTGYVPSWTALGLKAREINLPFVTGRIRLMASLLDRDSDAWAHVRRFGGEHETRISHYSEPALRRRASDYVAVDSLYFSRFEGSRLYPEMDAFFKGLLRGDFGYRMVFDEASAPPPRWAYPQKITQLDNRLVVLQRAAD